MKYFNHKDALTIEEASQALEQGAKAIAGGTDLLGVLKDKILPEYPEVVVNLKTITGMDKIEETEEGLKVGANVTLTEIIKEKQCVTLKGLAVSGKDLIALGMKPGKEIGACLNQLLERVIEEPQWNVRT